MSYCRFENTERDLRDCYRAMYESTKGMNEHEQAARLAMFNLVLEMADKIKSTRNNAVLLDGDPDAEYGEHCG